MTENELVRRLTAGLPGNAATVTGPGDDCAVLDFGVPGEWILFKADSVVEGVHFTPDTAPERVGHKALARALSDIGAMGGQAVSALITLGIDGRPDPDWLERLYAGMGALARRWEVSIAGGETTSNPGGLHIAVSVLGRVEKAKCLYRSGARVGDAVFVSGELGGSRAGRHLDFEPRLAEGAWLAGTGKAHALMDLSDGLGVDLGRMLTASGNCGVLLEEKSIPVSRAARDQAKGAGRALEGLLDEEWRGKALRAALTDGEDFELLFTTAAADAVAVLDGWKEQFPGVGLRCIGRIEEAPGIRLRGKDGMREIQADGYQHFQQS